MLCALLLTVLAITGPLLWFTKLWAASRGRKALRDKVARDATLAGAAP